LVLKDGASTFMPGESRFLILCISLMLSASLSAQTLAGSVNNGTTGKPAAGDSVVLITLGQGMGDGVRTRTDANGDFSFRLPDSGPHLIRVIHQGVTYHRMAPVVRQNLT
jgi:Carboxypeptidase regulatory-like domain